MGLGNWGIEPKANPASEFWLLDSRPLRSKRPNDLNERGDFKMLPFGQDQGGASFQPEAYAQYSED
jgi:hypothetical protein